MYIEYIHNLSSWMLPLFALLTAFLSFVLVYRLGRQRDKLYQERNTLYDFVHDVSETFVISEDTQIDFLLQRVLFYAQRTSLAGAGAIYFAEPNNEEFRARAVSGLFPPIISGFGKEPDASESWFQCARNLVEKQMALRGQGLVGEVAEEAIPVLIEDAERDARVPVFKNDFFQIRSILLIPMRFHSSVMGVIVLINRVDDAPFIQSDMRLLQSLADQASVTIYFAKFNEALAEKRLLDHDLKVARKIQKALLPSKVPDIEGFDVDFFTMPAGEVGGDYYDFVAIDQDHFGLTIADVSGKGVTGAMVMSICRSVFHANARTSTSPSHVLKTINDVICRDTYEDMFISMLYLVLNIRTNSVKIARAGHAHPFIVSNDGKDVKRVESRGIAMGLADKEAFNAELEEHVVTLRKGDVFVAYTDGFVEMVNSRQKEWGLQSLQSVVQSHADKGARGIVKNVREQA